MQNKLNYGALIYGLLSIRLSEPAKKKNWLEHFNKGQMGTAKSTPPPYTLYVGNATCHLLIFNFIAEHYGSINHKASHTIAH